MSMPTPGPRFAPRSSVYAAEMQAIKERREEAERAAAGEDLEPANDSSDPWMILAGLFGLFLIGSWIVFGIVEAVRWLFAATLGRLLAP